MAAGEPSFPLLPARQPLDQITEALEQLLQDPQQQAETRAQLAEFVCVDEVRKHGTSNHENPMVSHKDGCRMLVRGGAIITVGELLDIHGGTITRPCKACHEFDPPYPWEPTYPAWAKRNPKKARELEARF